MARIFRSFPVYRPLSRPLAFPSRLGGSVRLQTRIRPRPTVALYGPLPLVPFAPVGKAVLHTVERRHVAAIHPYHLVSRPPPAVVVSTRRRFAQII